MIFENTTFHLSDKYLFLNLSLSVELSEKQEHSKILPSALKLIRLIPLLTLIDTRDHILTYFPALTWILLETHSSAPTPHHTEHSLTGY